MATATPITRETGRRAAEALLLAFCPLAAFWAMHFTPVAQNGFTDPYVYTGYINNFEDLIHRYGATYYGVRFGLIAPAEFTATLFGPVGGYFVLRYAVALVAGVPFYIVARQRFGWRAAIVALSLLLTSPYFARAVLWDHPDATGVPFLLAALCLVLIERGRRWVLDGCAGVSAALAVHSNIFVAAPLAVFLISWSVLWLVWRRGLLVLAKRLIVISACLAVVTLLVSQYYESRVGLEDMFSITIEKSVELARGGMSEWRTPGGAWISRAWHVLTPVFLCAIAAAAWLRRRVEFQDAVIWGSGAAATLFFYVVQFGLNGNSLELFYYFSYLLPFVFLLLALIIGTLAEATDVRTRPAWFALLLAAADVPWIFYSFTNRIPFPADFRGYLALAGITTTLVALCRMPPRFRSVTALGAAGTVGFLIFASFSGPIYARMIDTRDGQSRREMDVYRVANQLIDSVPKRKAESGAVGFWYPNDPAENSLRSIQSTYLWGFSKVQGDGRGLPYLEPAEINRLGRMELSWLVLLSEKDGKFAAAHESLDRIGVPYQIVNNRILSSGTYTVNFQLLALPSGSVARAGN